MKIITDLHFKEIRKNKNLQKFNTCLLDKLKQYNQQDEIIQGITTKIQELHDRIEHK